MVVVNVALGVLFAVCLMNSNITGDGFAESRVFPIMSSILFFYFLVYGILWLFERRLFPDSVRPSDYLEGKTPALSEEEGGELNDEQHPGHR